MSQPNRRRLILAIKLLISVVLVGWLLYSVGVEDAFKRMMTVDPVWFALAVLVGTVHMVIGTIRWQAVLFALKETLPWGQIFRFMYIGGFFNQTLPSSVGGDAVRGYMAYKSGQSVRGAVNGVLLDRVITVFSLIFLSLIMSVLGASELKGGEWFRNGVWLVWGLALGGVAVLMVLDRLPARLSHLSFVRGMAALASDTRALFLRAPHNGLVALIGVVGHANISVLIFTLAMGLGLDVTLANCLLLFPPVLLIQTLPISVAGWGVREGAMVAMFALVGVPAEGVLAMSILFGLVLIIMSLPGLRGHQRQWHRPWEQKYWQTRSS